MAFQGGRQNVTVTNQYGNRSLGVTYTNNTGRPMLVVVTVNCTTVVAGDNAIAGGYINGNGAAEAGGTAGTTAVVFSGFYTIFLPVPAGSTYQVAKTVTGSGSVSVQYWWEILLVGSTGSI